MKCREIKFWKKWMENISTNYVSNGMQFLLKRSFQTEFLLLYPLTYILFHSNVSFIRLPSIELFVLVAFVVAESLSSFSAYLSVFLLIRFSISFAFASHFAQKNFLFITFIWVFFLLFSSTYFTVKRFYALVRANRWINKCIESFLFIWIKCRG